MSGYKAPLGTGLSADQTLVRSYDEVNNRHRVDAQVTATIGSVDVVIDAASGDNISIQDSDGNELQINPDGSINVVTTDSDNFAKDFGTTTDALRTASQTADAQGNGITSTASNSNRLLHTQTPDSVSSNGTLNALNSEVSVAIAGLSSVGFHLNTGTFIGTLWAEASINGGVNYTRVPFYDPTNGTQLQELLFGVANSMKILAIVPIGGASHIRVRVQSYSSGTVTGLLRASSVSGSTGITSAAAFSTIVNTFPSLVSNTPKLILASNPNRKYAYISNATAATVRIQFSSSTGLSASTGLIVPANDYLEISGDRLYTGDIYAYSSSDIDISVAEGSP